MSVRPDAAARPKSVFLHIGLHKTGTTYLQNVLRANRQALAEQSVCFPRGEQRHQTLAVWDLFGRRPKGAADSRINGQWDALLTEVAEDDLPTVLVSEEYLSLATVAQAKRAVAGFPGADVHVVVTVRDLGRVLVSAWQEDLKNDTTWTWDEFAAAVCDPRAGARNPARGFWLRQDLPAILERWGSVVPRDRIHIVTVPPSAAGRTALLQRFSSVVGIDPTALTGEPRWDNQTIGVAATEVLRRLNERLDHRLNQRQYARVVKAELAPALAKQLGSSRFGLPPDQEDWVRTRAEEMIATLEQASYRVTGDLSELLPTTSRDARRPDDATTEELLDASIQALAELAERHAKAWWARRPSDVTVDEGPRHRRVASAVRGAAFRVRRRGAELADRHPAAERLMRLYLSGRSAAQRRPRRASR